jgi:hypothetical protein
MKSFKFSFVALIAVLAMSFTVASHKGAFKAKVVDSKFNYTCSTTSDVVDFWYCKTGVGRTHIVSGTPVGSLPGAATCTFTNTHAGSGVICNEANVTFCCFQPNSTCSKPSCALPSDVAGAQIGTIHTKS